jgi:hypothetical protein
MHLRKSWQKGRGTVKAPAHTWLQADWTGVPAIPIEFLLSIDQPVEPLHDADLVYVHDRVAARRQAVIGRNELTGQFRSCSLLMSGLIQLRVK